MKKEKRTHSRSTPGENTAKMRFSRRGFLTTAMGLMAGVWALGKQFRDIISSKTETAGKSDPPFPPQLRRPRQAVVDVNALRRPHRWAG